MCATRHQQNGAASGAGEGEPAASLENHLLELVAHARGGAGEDPFGNPVLSVALAITRLCDREEIGVPGVAALVGRLTAAAFADRAGRLRAYVGGLDAEADEASLHAIFERLAQAGDAEAFRGALAAPRFAAVFTAHPTFAFSDAVGELLAQAASAADGERTSVIARAATLSHRAPADISLADEFARAEQAIENARDALDRMAGVALDVARARFPAEWTALVPCPVVLASWVGCDTDGRTDIGWWDTLRLRLETKRAQLERLAHQLGATGDAAAEPVARRVAEARVAVGRQIAAAPPLSCGTPDAESVRRFALALLRERDAALTEAAPLIALLDTAIAAATSDANRRTLAIARAGLAGHGLSLARPHFRLNAAQVHNALRRRIDIDGDPADPALRRSCLAAVNALMDRAEPPMPVDFGALMTEQTSATRLMMTVVQLLKHVDGSSPIRFLIAETETGYTLLAALWIARRFGIADRLEISPLFETPEALEHGERVLEEAFRSPHWREYLRRVGRLTVQFGYSDSGRYIGQLAATYWIERLRVRIGELLRRYGMADIELVLFDTHGESVGRGAHPGSLADRLAYLDPPVTRAALREAGIRTRHETSFQGSDGYVLFGTRALAFGAVARIAEHAFAALPAAGGGDDPIYGDPDYAAEFFTTIGQEMTALLDDPGYASLLGVFGPNLIDRAGSRPAVRADENRASGPRLIAHPRELRAIPNNAILQQLGWLANTLHGLGRAAARAPDTFLQRSEDSARFGRALGLALHALEVSDLDVIRAYIDTLDPGSWLDRARRTARPSRGEELVAIAHALEAFDLAPRLRRLFRRLAADWLALKPILPGKPMPARLVLLHALRLAAIHRIWLLATHIPDFSPADGLDRDALIQRLLRLEMEFALDRLDEIFPVTRDPATALDFGEPPGPREARTYEHEHRTLFEPMGRWFEIVRDLSAAIQHEVGAYG